MIQILLADDDILSLNRICGLIDWNANGYEIAGQAMGGCQALTLLEELKPDILILDIDMPDKNGVDVTREIQQRKIPVKVLILRSSRHTPCRVCPSQNRTCGFSASGSLQN